MITHLRSYVLTHSPTGLSAIQQQHKNAANTFEDIRTLLLNPDIDTVNVPHLEKEISVQELGSHFFRNIHNQVKQQVGKAVRECVISVRFHIFYSPTWSFTH